MPHQWYLYLILMAAAGLFVAGYDLHRRFHALTEKPEGSISLLIWKLFRFFTKAKEKQNASNVVTFNGIQPVAGDQIMFEDRTWVTLNAPLSGAESAAAQESAADAIAEKIMDAERFINNTIIENDLCSKILANVKLHYWHSVFDTERQPWHKDVLCWPEKGYLQWEIGSVYLTADKKYVTINLTDISVLVINLSGVGVFSFSEDVKPEKIDAASAYAIMVLDMISTTIPILRGGVKIRNAETFNACVAATLPTYLGCGNVSALLGYKLWFKATILLSFPYLFMRNVKGYALTAEELTACDSFHYLHFTKRANGDMEVTVAYNSVLVVIANTGLDSNRNIYPEGYELLPIVVADYYLEYLMTVVALAVNVRLPTDEIVNTYRIGNKMV